MKKIILFVPLVLFILISIAQVRPGDRRTPVRSRTLPTKTVKEEEKKDAKTTNTGTTPLINNVLLAAPSPI
ncbi:MAG: hypothetical protein ABIN48_03375, partial [Ginsengibacter sp.]